MSRFIGNCSTIIDWDSVIASIQDQSPGYLGPRHRKDDPVIGVNEIATAWEEAGYVFAAEGGSVGWNMYFPGQHFDKDILNTFAEYVGIDPVDAWISKLSPGMFAPLHWDANDKEEEYNNLADMLRFSCHVSKPAAGHIFIVDGEYLYNQAQGNVYQWDSRKSQHAGANFGYESKYLFNVFGHKL